MKLKTNVMSSVAIAKSRHLFRHLLTLLFLTLLLFSCSDVEETAPKSDSSKTLGHVVVKLQDDTARTITAEKINLDDCSFTLEGKMNTTYAEASDTSETSFKKTWETYEKMQGDGELYLALGFWDFFLTVEKDGEALYTSETTVKIVAGENHLGFKLKEVEGKGNAHVTLTFPMASGIDTVKAGLFKISDGSEVSGFGFEGLSFVGNSAIYEKSDIPSGNYILKFEFLDASGNEIFLGMMELIQIKKNRTSTKELAIEKLATKNFKYGDYGFVTMLKAEGGSSIINAIETVPKNMPATAFYWSVESDTITGLSIDEEGFLSTSDTISDYPATAKVTATPKSGGEKIECVVLVDDDLSLTRAELLKYCTKKSIDYATMTNFEIPYGYTELADGEYDSSVPGNYTGAFCGWENLKKVTIPETITKIGNYSFQNCAEIENITIPGNVQTIGNYAFYHCDGLKTIEIKYGVKTIGERAFAGYSFYNNVAIEEIKIPKSVTTIGEYAFTSLQSSDGFDVIFTGDTPVTSMTIGNYAFQGAKGLKSINLPDNLTAIGAYAFQSCDRLTSITIPGSVKSIGDPTKEQGAFENCSGLEEIIIKDGVEEIGYGAFQCYSYNNVITQISIPKSVKTIGKFAFRYMKNPDGFTVTFTDSGEKNADAMTIGDNAFVSSSGLRIIENFPDNVTSIGKYAFNDCSNLSGEIKIPEGATTIGEYAFQRCSNIQEISLPSTITSLGQGAFQYCYAIETITIANGITELPSYAFQNNKITSIVIPESVTKIGQSVFADCESLAEVKILSTANNIDIGNNAFTYISNGVAVYFYATTPPTISGAFRSSDSPIFYVPSAAVADYQAACDNSTNGWSSDYKDSIQEMP